jgi:Ca2+:H+ antiporter
MNVLLKEIRHNPLLWLLGFVPVVFVAARLGPDAHTLLFVLSVLAIVPLAALLSHATESVAAKTGDAAGGLLNATLGNLTELVIALTALRAGQYTLVKASIAGAIVTNTLFMLGASFLLGGLRHHVQEYNRVTARTQAGLLFLAAVALLVPSLVVNVDPVARPAFIQKLSVGSAVLLFTTYGLGMLFSLKTHREAFASAEHAEDQETPWPIGVALAALAAVTVLVALVSEIFVESVQKAAEAFGMSPAFVGFIVVALVGGAAEMASAFSGARKNRLDLSVGIALGSASQIALFVAPVLVLASYVIGPTPMDLQFWPGAVVMVFIATLTAALVTNSGRSAWFAGVLVLMVYLIFAMTLYLLPPEGSERAMQASPKTLDPHNNRLRLGFHDQLVGNVVLVDVADVGRRLRPNLLGGDILHVVEPDVRIQPALGSFLAHLGNAARAGIVGSEGKEGLVQLGHRLLLVVLVDHQPHVLDAGVDVRLDFGDVAHPKILAGLGHDLHYADGAHRAFDSLVELGFLVSLGSH